MIREPVRTYLNDSFGNYMVTSMYGLCLLIGIQGSPLQAIRHIIDFCYVHWTRPGIYPQVYGYSLWTHPVTSGHVQGYIHNIASGHIQRPLDMSGDMSTRTWICPLGYIQGVWTRPGIYPQEHGYSLWICPGASGHVRGYIHKNMDMS